MRDEARRSPDSAGRPEQGYAPGGNPADPNEHRHGSTVHSHEHNGPHEHGDDLEYDEAHDSDMESTPDHRAT